MSKTVFCFMELKMLGIKYLPMVCRVLAITSFGKDLEERLVNLLKMLKIQFDGKYYRKDIGLDL